jgi:hypothetical protein
MHNAWIHTEKNVSDHSDGIYAAIPIVSLSRDTAREREREQASAREAKKGFKFNTGAHWMELKGRCFKLNASLLQL